MRFHAFLLLLACGTCAFAQTAEDRLFRAIEDGKQLVAEGVVARGGAKLDAKNAKSETALHLAIEKEYRPLAEALVKAGAPPNARTDSGETPLHYAALIEDPWAVELLFTVRADTRARND